MAFDHLQESFQGGEISTRLRGRVLQALYHAGLAQCSDWEPTPQGSLCRRGGSVFTDMLPNDPGVRLIPMRLSNEQDVILALSDAELRIYTAEGGVLLSTPGTELIVNGSFSSGGTGWVVTTPGSSAVTFSSAGAKMAAHSYGTTKDVPKIAQDFTPPSAATATLRVVWGSQTGILDWARVKVIRVSDGATIMQYQAKPTPGTVLNQPVEVAAGVAYRISIEAQATYSSSVPFKTFDATQVVTSVSLSYESGGGSGGYVIESPWSSAQLGALQYANESAGDRMFFAHPEVRPYYLQRAASGTWSLLPMTFPAATSPAVDPPPEWEDGNWPSVVEYFQGRLWLGATPSQRNYLWGSRVGNPFDFTDKTEITTGNWEPLDTDLVKIPAATKGAIHWVSAWQVLLFGTDLSGHSVSAGSGMLRPSDFQVKDESGFGSAALQAVRLGEQALFCSRDGRKVYAVEYALQTQSWASQDLTFIAEHLTRAGIAEMHYARDPNGTIVLLLADGTCAMCTYNRAAQVAAWWTLSLVGGAILSAAVSNGPQGSVLHLAVQRDAGVCLEFLPLSEFHSARVYLDAAASYTVPVLPGATVPGLDHLEGQAVKVLLDGQWVGDATVSGGAVPMPEGAVGGQVVTVGLLYTPTVKTLPPAPPGRNGASALRAQRRWTQVFLRLNESALPVVEGDRIAADRAEGDPMDVAQPGWTGDYGGSIDSDWSSRGQLTITSDLPYRTEILALFGSVEENEV